MAHPPCKRSLATERAPERFHLGVNLPWRTYGCDFGSNAWGLGGLASQDDDVLRTVLEQARDSGADLVRWFVLCDGRAGIEYDAQGVPVRLQPSVFDDLDRALDLVGGAGLRLVPVLFDFLWARRGALVNGVQCGGRARAIRDPVIRHHLLTRCVDPLVARIGRDPRVAMWDLCNEPEWMTRAAWSRSERLPRQLVRQWLRELGAHVRCASAHPLTVGLATARGLRLVRGQDLDVLQVHWYDRHQRRSPLERCPGADHDTRPVVLGEFPTAASRRTPVEILRTARDAGYSGAWGWSLLAEDAASDRQALLTALRQVAADTRDEAR